MKVVLDTNILLISVLRTSKYKPNFDAILSNKVVTNDKHFDILKDIDFPAMDVVNSDEFLLELKEL